MKQLLIDSIRIDGQTQSRAAIHDATVTEYAEAIQTGAKLPPVTVYFDGTVYWLSDGFHRLLALSRAGKRNVPAEVKQGTREDAAWASAGANVTHGLRRTNEDKRKATEMALLLRPDLADLALAEYCGVHENSVKAVRREMEATSQIVRSDIRERKDGTRFRLRPPRPRAQPPTRPPVPAPAIIPAASTPPPPKPPVRKPGPVAGQADKTGKPIPDHLLPIWDRGREIDAMLRQVSEIRTAVQRSQDDADPLFAELNHSSVMAALNCAYDALKATRPFAVCPWCCGTLSEHCRGCKGRVAFSAS